MTLRDRVLGRLRPWLVRAAGFADATRSFSQEGEDLILATHFQGRAPGVYVDIGAHHPRRFSNTYLLYEKGWRGIVVDPTPGFAALHRLARPEDTIIEAAVGSEPGRATLYLYDESALNTLSLERQRELRSRGVRPRGEVEVDVRRLDEILEQQRTPTSFEFVSVDVEGWERDVLGSNNWRRFRPQVVACEDLTRPVGGESGEVASFLREQGYSMFASTIRTLFFLDAGQA